MKMNRLLATIMGCLLVTVSVHAQKENNIWYFGDHAGIDFNSGSPVPLSNSAMGQPEVEGCATISDRTTGKLLFYTSGTTVWNNNHTPMPHGADLYSNPSSSQSEVIVPMPGSTTKYYVFTADAGGTNGKGIAYSIVDMTLDGGAGDVDTLNKNISLLPTAAEKLTAVQVCQQSEEGTAVYVAAHEMENNTFDVWRVTSSGVSVAIKSNIGSILSQASGGYAGCMKFSHDGKKLAMAAYGGLAEVYDFDAATGELSNPITLQLHATGWSEYGVCFSPDNSRLYVSDIFRVNNKWNSTIYQFSLLAGDSNAIANSGTEIFSFIGGNTHTGFCAGMEVGPDGKLYTARTLSNFLSMITDPNALGATCNFVNNGFILSTGTCWYGLPNNVSKCQSSGSTVQDENQAPPLLSTLTVYPNPAAIETTLSFFLGEKKQVSLAIHDLLGRTVFSSFDKQYLEKGPHSIAVKTGLLPEGLYLCSLHDGTHTTIQKMIVYR